MEELLRLVADGGIHSCQDLASRLSVSLSFLEAMLEDLTRLGYLRAVRGDGCPGHCAACPIGNCSIAGADRLWTLTAKGAKAADRL